MFMLVTGRPRPVDIAAGRVRSEFVPGYAAITLPYYGAVREEFHGARVQTSGPDSPAPSTCRSSSFAVRAIPTRSGGNKIVDAASECGGFWKRIAGDGGFGRATCLKSLGRVKGSGFSDQERFLPSPWGESEGVADNYLQPSWAVHLCPAPRPSPQRRGRMRVCVVVGLRRSTIKTAGPWCAPRPPGFAPGR